MDDPRGSPNHAGLPNEHFLTSASILVILHMDKSTLTTIFHLNF